MMHRNAPADVGNKSLMVSELAAHLAAVQNVLAHGDLTEAMRGCNDLIRRDTARSFAGFTSPAGEAWPPHAPATVKKMGEHPLEYVTGALNVAATGGEGSVTIIEPRSVAAGLNLDAGPPSLKGARAQNFGYPAGHLPERRFLGLSEEGKSECGARILADTSSLLQAV